MLTKAYVSGTIKGEIAMMEASQLKKKKKASKKKVNKILKFKDKPTPIIQYSELGFPVICGGGKSMREMYEEERIGL